MHNDHPQAAVFRQELIHDTPEFRLEQKRRKAIEALGERHVLHASNRVKRAPHKQPEITRVDVGRTIKRYLERIGKLTAEAEALA